MKILGISAYYHDAAVCLTENGKILFAAQEERYSRIKNDASFPGKAIAACMEYTGIRLQDVDAIVYYEKPFLKLERLLHTYLMHAPKGLRSFVQAMQVWSKEKLFIKQNIYSALKDIDDSFQKKQVALLFSEHHLSHAASAFFCSGFTEAAILTTDGVGEYATTSLAQGCRNNITTLREIHFPHSLGLLYSAATYYLGFKVNSDEYKVMGLAAYGQPEHPETQEYIRIIEKDLIHIHEDGSYKLITDHFTYMHALRMVDDKVWLQLFGLQKRATEEPLTQQHCNFAYAFQKVTEKAVLLLCKELKRITSSEYLCLAGGVALNSVINGILKDSGLFKEIFIQPAGGDAGGAIGAALAAYHIHFKQERTIILPDAMQNSLLGSAFSPDEVAVIQQSHPQFYLCADEQELCEKTARHIAEGKVIGWFQGRMEFGPRALGNRSILADARHPEMQKHLNLAIKNRESFRPFAPAVLEEDVQAYFEMTGTSPYMLQVHPIKKEYRCPLPEHYSDLSMNEKLYTIKSAFPAVTHVDMSARIQTVNQSQHPLFYQLIHTFKQQTGCGMLVNTSFNVKDEPIVCTPADAYQCFIKTGMDVLVIGNCIFYK